MDQRVVGVAHGGHAEAHPHVPVALAAHPHRCAGLKSPVREIRTPGSVGGRRGNPALYPTRLDRLSEGGREEPKSVRQFESSTVRQFFESGTAQRTPPIQ